MANDTKGPSEKDKEASRYPCLEMTVMHHHANEVTYVLMPDVTIHVGSCIVA